MVKFKGPYAKMDDKPYLEEQKDKVSLVEKCPDMSIPKLLKMMPEGGLDTIFDGYGEDIDERSVLESEFAYEDESSDAADIFEENQRLVEQLELEQAIKQKEKSSSADAPVEQRQDDTTLPPKAE